jgi:hypothetical protein
MEHPPTWIGLLHEAYTNTAMRKVGLSKICERRQYEEGLKKLGPMFRSMMPETIAMAEGNGSNGATAVLL